MNSDDSFHVRAAEGWLGLGDLKSAMEELDAIAPELRTHPDVLVVRCEIYSKAKKWDAVVNLAEAIVKLSPKKQLAWIDRSFALHELDRTQEAFDLLLPAVTRFPKFWLVPYNLACYCAQLGRITAAEDWFKKAIALNENHVKDFALDDPDLEPLWKGMEGTKWKRVG